MRWFKHFSDANRDPKLISLIDEYGLEGYGIWWIICEVVADQYHANGIPELETSAKGWRKLTGIYPKKFEKVVRFLEKAQLLSATFFEKGIKVYIPKMSEYKDNHTRNLQAACKQEEEVEKEEEVDKNLLCPQQAGGPPKCPHNEIVSLYHEILPELPKVRVWSEERQKKLRARWREDEQRQNLDWWKGLFEYIRNCPWLMGEVEGANGRTFEMDLEWVVNKSNMIKIIEGKYVDRLGS